MEKRKSLIIRLSENDLKSYKKLCEDNGFTMSKRIRNFIRNEMGSMVNKRNEI